MSCPSSPPTSPPSSCPAAPEGASLGPCIRRTWISPSARAAVLCCHTDVACQCRLGARLGYDAVCLAASTAAPSSSCLAGRRAPPPHALRERTRRRRPSGRPGARRAGHRVQSQPAEPGQATELDRGDSTSSALPCWRQAIVRMWRTCSTRQARLLTIDDSDRIGSSRRTFGAPPIASSDLAISAPTPSIGVREQRSSCGHSRVRMSDLALRRGALAVGGLRNGREVARGRRTPALAQLVPTGDSATVASCRQRRGW